MSTLNLHSSIMAQMVQDRAPSRLEKIAAQYEKLQRASLDLAWHVKRGAAKEVEVSDVIGEPSPEHPGHMSNIEAHVIEEAIRQRQLALKKKAEDTQACITYVMQIEGGPELLKAAKAQGIALAEYLWENDRPEAERMLKSGFNVSPEIEALAKATPGATAADLAKSISSGVIKKTIGRAAIGVPGGYFAGQAMGNTPAEKDRYSRIGMAAGGAGAGLAGLSASHGAAGDLGQLKLLEKGMNIPAASAAFKGTSLEREWAIRKGARQVLSENKPKVAAADDIDPAAPGSLLAHLVKAAGAEAGFLRELPIGRILGGAAVGGVAGNMAAGSNKKKEKAYTLGGAAAGAGLAYGFRPGATGTAGTAGAKAVGEAVPANALTEAGESIVKPANRFGLRTMRQRQNIEAHEKLRNNPEMLRSLSESSNPAHQTMYKEHLDYLDSIVGP